MLQFILLLATAVLVGIDQLTKYLVISNMEVDQSIPVIDGVFELLRHHNPGAAFGILPNQRWIFITFTFIVMLVILVILMSGKFRKYKLANAAGVLILAGGIGNMVDRLAYGYVVDFLYAKFINFPIFNFADCCVVIGAALLLVAFLFVYKEDTVPPAKEEALPAEDGDISREQEDVTQDEDRRDDGSAGDGGQPA